MGFPFAVYLDPADQRPALFLPAASLRSHLRLRHPRRTPCRQTGQTWQPERAAAPDNERWHLDVSGNAVLLDGVRAAGALREALYVLTDHAYSGARRPGHR